MISTLRQRVRENGEAVITLEEFNQLKAEWITRTKIEDLHESLSSQKFMDQIDADREAIKFLEERGKALGAERLVWEEHVKSGSKIFRIKKVTSVEPKANSLDLSRWIALAT